MGGPATPVYCPRCGADRTVTFSTDYACGRCGHVWPHGRPAPVTVPVTTEPALSPKERYQTRRRLDERLAQDF